MSIYEAIKRLHDELKLNSVDNCVSFSVFFNCEGYSFEETIRTGEELKKSGISMRNLRGHFIEREEEDYDNHPEYKHGEYRRGDIVYIDSDVVEGGKVSWGMDILEYKEIFPDNEGVLDFFDPDKLAWHLRGEGDGGYIPPFYIRLKKRFK